MDGKEDELREENRKRCEREKRGKRRREGGITGKIRMEKKKLREGYRKKAKEGKDDWNKEGKECRDGIG